MKHHFMFIYMLYSQGSVWSGQKTTEACDWVIGHISPINGDLMHLV